MPPPDHRKPGLLRRVLDRIGRRNARAADISRKRTAVKRSASRGRHGPTVPGPFDR